MACAASIGCLLVKNGYFKNATQKEPCKLLDPPFDPNVQQGGLWPQLTMKMRCDRMHDVTKEQVRNREYHCSPSARKRIHCANKGELKYLCNNTVAITRMCYGRLLMLAWNRYF